MTRKRPTSTVRALREKVGLTQFELAAKSGLSLQTISLAERAGLVSDATAAKLAMVLGVEPAEIRP